MIEQAKKFGTFAGVFTPSILTILGVIMYMRLGWVVGEAGIIAALGIIVISHIISLSTGLSISSIATDKRIKTGGIYYILSRSLGLPMGGSIGITLFVGTALSISLYIVGFAESFLGIEAIRDFLGMTGSKNDIRIIGTIVIISLVILAFISTSLAIKTQFFILGAIVLSLISIFIGFLINTEYAPEKIVTGIASEEVSLEFVFAIFFPAVTGFTAGVAMSGDLKDPKKTIPLGTMSSIIVGFVVYIILAISFAYFVKRDMLINDINFLLKIAWFSPLVIAGVWGATLSSALGGILGGPRILQAIANDKIVPKTLGKGYGASNEPRNALIFIFFIAEGGILIGELNFIAKIVSIFYLASYGFINLAYTLESWASTDFRPTFKINKFVGIIGFMSCFAVMFKLDMVSMFIAFTLMALIYFILKKREVELDFGDVWQSVWSSVLRTALHKMDSKEIEERNWQPNIILFSGGTNKRPHLIEFGKAIVGKHGILSNFDLHENKDAKFLFPKHKQSIINKNEKVQGVFTRRQTCKDIYKGIEIIASSYGFSGVEPNTVLMGWARQSRNPDKFVHMIRQISDLDLNILLMDYDKRYGFGKHKLIDIWWRGAGNHGNLALLLSRFIWSSAKWEEAKIRLMIVNQVNDESSKVYKKAESVFEALRIDAEIRIINNQIEQKPFYDIIRVESINTDIIFLGVPEIEEGKEKEFVINTSDLMLDIGTVILVKASSYFKELNFGSQRHLVLKNETLASVNLLIAEDIETPEFKLPESNQIAENILKLNKDVHNINSGYFNNYFMKIFEYDNKLTDLITDEILKCYDIIEQKVLQNPEANHSSHITAIQNSIYIQTRIMLEELQSEELDTQRDLLGEAQKYYIEKINELVQSIPQYHFNIYGKNDLVINQNDSNAVKRFKQRKKLEIKITGHPIQYKVQYNKFIKSYFPIEIYEIIDDVLTKWGLISLQNIIEYKSLLKSVRTSLQLYENKAIKKQLSKEILEIEKKKIYDKIENLKLLNKKTQQSLYPYIITKLNGLFHKISDDVSHLNINNQINFIKNRKEKLNNLSKNIIEKPNIWFNNQNLMYNETIMELMLYNFENRLRKIFTDTSSKIFDTFDNNCFKNLNYLRDYIDDYKSKIEDKTKPKFAPEYSSLILEKEAYYELFDNILEQTFKDLKNAVEQFPDNINIMSSESYNDFNIRQYDSIEVVNVSASKLVDYLVQVELMEPLRELIDRLPDRLIEANNIGLNIIRLISFSIHETNGKLMLNESKSIDEIYKFINNQNEKIDSYTLEIRKIKENIRLQINERLGSTINKLSVYSIIKEALNLKQYIVKQETKRKFSKFRNQFYKFSSFVNHQVDQFWYRQSEAILLAKDINSIESKGITKVNDLLDFIDEISLKSNVINKLPFYYQQLFLQKHNYNNEFWYGRKNEIEKAIITYKRYNSGYYGAMLVVGEQNSGKTFFSYHISSSLVESSNVFIVNPPIGGSLNPKIFKKTFEEAVLIKGSYNQIFNKIAPQSIIIIDDLELWWEKSATGFTLVNDIIELIEKYSHKCFFIINVNIHSFEIINRIRPIQNHFLNIVECKPFNAEDLKNIVLFRHESSGLKFNLKVKSLTLSSKHQNQFRSMDFANLFAKYFNYSKGNIGTTLLAWVANIIEFNNKVLTISPPKAPNISVLDNIKTDTFVILVQFILHKHITVKKLERILLQDSKTIIGKLNYLKRSGLIVEETENIYRLNEYLYIHLINKLQNIEML